MKGGNRRSNNGSRDTKSAKATGKASVAAMSSTWGSGSNFYVNANSMNLGVGYKVLQTTNTTSIHAASEQLNSPTTPTEPNGNTVNNENDEDIDFYDILNLERQAWSEERARLLSVIEIQQKEIERRTNGNQEKAIEVARSFGDAIGIFEQRLLGVEQGVLNELKLLRSRLTQTATASTGSNNKASNNDERLTSIEKSVSELNLTLQKLLSGTTV